MRNGMQWQPPPGVGVVIAMYGTNAVGDLQVCILRAASGLSSQCVTWVRSRQGPIHPAPMLQDPWQPRARGV
jgi:hypothetical protein